MWMYKIIFLCILVISHIQTKTISPEIQQNTQETDTAQQNCTQSYPRLFFTSQRDTMLVKFNTISPCNRSYVTIQQEHSVSKFYCISQKLSITQSTTYVRYIQNCTITLNLAFQSFNYVVYGSSPNSAPGGYYHRSTIRAEKQTQSKQQSKSYFVNIPQQNSSFNMVVVADWGPILVRQYQPIYPSLLQQIKTNKNKINAMMIMGDIAYDLVSNQCQQYEIFMKELSTVSGNLPIIPIFGNHQSYTELNFLMFKMTFQVYNLSSIKKVQAYQFWNFKIVTFDPFLQIYAISTDEEQLALKTALFQNLNKNKSKDSQFVILSSHYPLICSQQVFHCKQTLKEMGSLYAQISKIKQVDLYLGAHMHQYQRIVPFYDGNFTISNLGPYSKGSMVSIVQGVAGNDIGILDQDFVTEKYSVTHTYNKTGYGILTVSNLTGTPYAKYSHYCTISPTQTKLFDQVYFSTK